jgi:hypothetical protein
MGVWAHSKIKLLEANEHFPVSKIDAVCHGLHSKTSSADANIDFLDHPIDNFVAILLDQKTNCIP